jgi:hypothetical protein
MTHLRGTSTGSKPESGRADQGPVSNRAVTGPAKRRIEGAD